MTGKLHLGLIGLCLVLGTITLRSQVECQVDSNKLLIGDQRSMEISIRGMQDVPDSIDFKPWNNQAFVVLKQNPWTQTSDGIRKSLRFTVFDTGYIRLQPLPITFHDGQKSDTIYSNDLALEVFPVVVDSTGLAPLKDIIREPLALKDLAIYLAGILLVMAAVGLYLWRQKQSHAQEQVVVLSRPAHEIALEKLTVLSEKKLWQQGHIKVYQSELTHIIREYLESRFSLRALESTTPEILQEVRKHVDDKRLLEDLDQILNMADLIKFAKARPAIDIHQQFMDKTESFILTTKADSSITNDGELD